MKDIRYRLASLSDIEIITEMRIAFLSELNGKPDTASEQLLRASLHTYFTRSIPEQSFICCLAETENEVVGIGAVVLRQRAGHFKNPEGKEGYIMSMYTKPAFRKRGISGNILRRLISEAKLLGTNYFELHATAEGEPLYIKNGFLKHNEPTYRKTE